LSHADRQRVTAERKPAEKEGAAAGTADDASLLAQVTLDDAITAGDVKVDGRKEAIGEFFGMLDTFDFWFNIVTP
jgi:alkyl sulfatase BDS1-like metallo-beta-lactamase superfamily hydrolase